MHTKSKNRIIALILAAMFVLTSSFATPQSAYAASWVDKANTWATSIANDNSYHYVSWTDNPQTRECPICCKHPAGPTHGWNCVGFAWAIWHHGGNLKNNCHCNVLPDPKANEMYKASSSKALKIAKKRTGLKNIKVIRNKKGIPKSKWRAGDICLQFKNGKYYHTFYYMGNKKICDSRGDASNNDQIAIRSYKNYKAHIIVRYKG